MIFERMLEPVPFMIAMGDSFSVDQSLKSKQDPRRIGKLLAMSPDARLHWNECWKKYVRTLEAAGKDVAKEIYGPEARKQASDS